MNTNIQNIWDNNIAHIDINNTSAGVNTTAQDPKAYLYGDGKLTYTYTGRTATSEAIFEEVVIIYRKWVMIAAVIGILSMLFTGSTQFLEASLITVAVTLVGVYPYARNKVASRQQMYALD